MNNYFLKNLYFYCGNNICHPITTIILKNFFFVEFLRLNPDPLHQWFICRPSVWWASILKSMIDLTCRPVILALYTADSPFRVSFKSGSWIKCRVSDKNVAFF